MDYMESGKLLMLKQSCVSPSSVSEIEKALPPAPSRFRKDAEGVCRIIAASGAEMSLNSRHDPVGEAKRQVKSWLDSFGSGRPCKFILFIGLGSGFQLSAILDVIRPGSIVMVADADPEIFVASYLSSEPSMFMRDGVKVVYSVSSDCGGVISDFDKALTSFGDGFSASVFVNHTVRRAFPQKYDELISGFTGVMRRKHAEGITLAALCGEWMANSIENLSLVPEIPKFDSLEGLYRGGTGIMAAAGPSLDKTIPEIRKLNGKVPVIAVGTALRPLLKAGIKVDFTIVVDSDPLILKQFEGLPENSKFHVLLPHHMLPELPRRFKDRTFFFSTGIAGGINRLLDSAGALPRELRTAGTVSLTALEAMRYMGFRRIILAGLDLAMGESAVTHASNSMYDGARANTESLVEVDCADGGKVFTTRQFAIYIGMMNEYLPELASCGIEILNTSCRGAAFKCVKTARPEDIPELCADSCLSQAATCDIFRIWRNAPRIDKDVFFRTLSKTASDLSAVEKLGREAELACGEIFGPRSKKRDPGMFLAKLDELDSRLKCHDVASMMLNEAVQPMLLNLTMKSGRSGEVSDSASGEELNRVFYRSVSEAAGGIAARLNSVLNNTVKENG